MVRKVRIADIEDNAFSDFVGNFGADPTGATNSDAAWTAAVAAGGRVYVPNGTYVFTTNKTVSSINGLSIEGESVASGASGGVIFQFSTTTGDCITFDNCQHCDIRHIRFKPVVRRTSGADIAFDGGCFMCSTHDCRHENSWNALHIKHATDTEIHRLLYREQYGSEQILYGRGASVSERSFRCTLHNCRGDNPYSVEPNAVTHANTTAYALGDVIREASGFYECTTAGTSGTGTPPTAPGGTTAAEGFTTEITDGTVGWTYRAHQELTGVTFDSYAYSLIIEEGAYLNGWLGFYMRDTIGAASNASVPSILRGYGVECDHNHLYGIILSAGSDVRFIAPWVSSALDGNGIVLGSSFLGDMTIKGGRSFGNAEHGVLVQAGPEAWELDGLFVSANSQKTSDTYHGITLANNAADGIVTNCITRNINGGSNPQAYGMLSGSGVSDLTIVDNDFRGNTTGAYTGPDLDETSVLKNNKGVFSFASGSEWEIYKTADQTGIGTSFVDVSSLTFPNLVANAAYAFEFWILADAALATTGIDVSVNGPASPTALTFTMRYWTSATVMTQRGGTAYDANTASTAGPGTSRRMFKVEGIVRNGSNTGTLAARVKAETGTGVNVRAGSWGRIKRLA